MKTSAKVAKKKGNKASVAAQYKSAVLDSAGYAKRFALAHSPYLNTLLDPYNMNGVKIPDDNTAPSFTFQTLSKVSLSATTAGGQTGCGACYALGNGIASAMYQWIPTSTAGTYGTQAVANSTQWQTQIAANCMQVRPVSACLMASASGSTQTDQGRLYAAYLPPGEGVLSGATVSAQNVATTVAAHLNAAYSVDVPVSKRMIRIIWLPIDEIARMYITPGQAINATRGGASGALTYGSLSVIADGCQAANSFEFILVVNWEAIPLNSLTSILQATPSSSDPMELAAAANVISSHPKVATIQLPEQSDVGTPAVAGMVAKPSGGGSSFIDKLLYGMNKGVDIAKVLAPAASAALALL